VCGIVLIAGPGASEGLFRQMPPPARAATWRKFTGPTAYWRERSDADRPPARATQPWISADGRWLLCYNGEIYNYRALRADLRALGCSFRTKSDTEVIMEAFAQWGESAVRRLRGEFAFAITERSTGHTYLARDPFGVKPLYWSSANGCLHIASEIKALVPAAAQVFEVPPGSHGWAAPRRAPALTPYGDLLSFERLAGAGTQVTDAAEAAALVRAALADAIAVRTDTRLRVGVILSGGLDSSLTLAHVREHHPDCVAFTVGAPGSADIAYASTLAADLGVRHEIIEIPPRSIKLDQVRRPSGSRAHRVRRHHQRCRVGAAVPPDRQHGHQGRAHRRRLGRVVRRIRDV
jgi:asparagine synthase (glutamine-hydrolysing)